MVHYILVRNIPKGNCAAYVAHAAGESAGGPLPKNTSVVVLEVEDELELRAYAGRLTANGLPFELIVETEGPYADQAMAIGLHPIPRADRQTIRKVVSSLPLVR